LPENYSLYPDAGAVAMISAYLEVPPDYLDRILLEPVYQRGEGKVEYSMKDADGNLTFLVQINEGKHMAFVPTRDTEEDGDTLVYKWVSEADLEEMNKQNVTNRKSRRRRSRRRSRSRKQRRGTRRN
jgi:hypothetical protein